MAKDGLINCKKCGTLFFQTSQREVCDECFKKELDLIDDIKSLKTSNNRIGIITKSLKEAIELYESIKDKVENVSVCDGNESALSEIVILPSYMSKGLEFDSIISYSKSDMDYLENPNVQKQRKALQDLIEKYGFEYEMLTWETKAENHKELKGLDDYYAYHLRNV